MAAPAVVVPSAHIIQLGQHLDGGKALAFARKQKYAAQHPEWRLAADENVDWSMCRGTVLDASYSALPTLDPIAAAAPAFGRLTVLCLRDSGLVDIELLQRCTKLVHLDLSSNEIVHLVGGDFWASFQELLVLLLHGNKVCGISDVQGYDSQDWSRHWSHSSNAKQHMSLHYSQKKIKTARLLSRDPRYFHLAADSRSHRV